MNNIFTDDKDKLRIVVWGANRTACGWYRLRQPLMMLQKEKLVEVYYVEQEEFKDLEAVVSKADLFILRDAYSYDFRLLRKMYPKTPIICDIDDDTSSLAPSNEHYRDFGEEEVIIKGNTQDVALWKQGVDGFDKYRNAHGNIERRLVLEGVDYIQTTTKKLALRLAELYKNKVVIMPNAIDFTLYPDVVVTGKPKGELRIGWSGGVSHGSDFEEVGQMIATKMKLYPNLHYYSYGAHYSNHFEGIDEKRVHIFPWIDFQAHPFRMLTDQLDIMIAPLEDLEFNTYKSEIRFSEYSALKLPTIAKNLEPYNVVIKDGENGLLYKDTKEFGQKLESLVKDPIYRARIALNAFEWVKSNRESMLVSKEVYNFYKKVVDDSKRDIK